MNSSAENAADTSALAHVNANPAPELKIISAANAHSARSGLMVLVSATPKTDTKT